MKKFKQWIFEKWYRQEAGRLELLGWLEGINISQRIIQAVITDTERMLTLPNFSKRDREKGLGLIQRIRQDLAGAVAQAVKLKTGHDIPVPSGQKVIKLPIGVRPAHKPNELPVVAHVEAPKPPDPTDGGIQ
jgi:hypothetical protein